MVVSAACILRSKNNLLNPPNSSNNSKISQLRDKVMVVWLIRTKTTIDLEFTTTLLRLEVPQQLAEGIIRSSLSALLMEEQVL